MNILVVSAVFPPEPVVSSLLSFDIANELVKRGNNVTVICPKPTRPFGYNISNEVHHDSNYVKIILNSYTSPESKILERLRESYSFGIHCSRFIKNNHKNIDAIYANAWPLFAQYFIVKEANNYNIPIILHIQDIYPESIAEKQAVFIKWVLLKLFVPFDKSVLRKCTKVIAISAAMRQNLISTRQIDNKRVSVVRNWQNDDKFLNFDKTLINRNPEFIFMFLGNISPSAGVETLIHAFGKAKLENCKLIIAGEGSDKQSCMKASLLYPEVKIDFIPAQINKVHLIQHEADVLLLPLKQGISGTATPSKLTAYMFSGRPIIACVERDSDVAKTITEANCGWICEPENVTGLSTLLAIIVSLNSEILVEFGRNGLNYAKEYLSRERNLNLLVNIIIEK